MIATCASCYLAAGTKPRSLSDLELVESNRFIGSQQGFTKTDSFEFFLDEKIITSPFLHNYRVYKPCFKVKTLSTVTSLDIKNTFSQTP